LPNNGKTVEENLQDDVKSEGSESGDDGLL